MPMSTVEVTRQGPRPAIRLRPAPRHEPPFDDERDPSTWPSPHQLALDWTVPPRPPVEPPPPPVRRTVVTGASAEAKTAVRRFVGMCLEVLNGYRPAAHLRSLSQPREAGNVVAQGLVGARRVSEARQSRMAGRAPRPRRPAPAAVVRLRLCEPREGAVEGAAVVLLGERTHAMAFRLELLDGVWLATVFRFI
ncbi:Rv3235 family protein [Actinoplanes sp. NPDC004185]